MRKKASCRFDVENRQTKTLLESPEPGDYLWAWMSPDGKLLLVLTKKGKLVLVDVGTGKKTPLKEELPRGFKTLRILALRNLLRGNRRNGRQRVAVLGTDPGRGFR